MTTTRDHRTDTLLRELDPAGPADAHDPVARALLEQVLASDPAGTAPHRRTTGRRWASACGLVAAAACTVAVLPAVNGGDPAFATWRAVPDAMTPTQGDAAAQSCRDGQRSGAGRDHAAALDTARVAVSERRGAWTTVVLAGAGGFQALCVGDSSTRLFDAMFGSVGVARVPAAGARQVRATDLGVGSIGEAELSLAAGTIGDQVRALSYSSPGRGRVEATVGEGHFALWLPGDEFAASASTGVPVRVTYRDGTSAEVTLRL